MNFILKIVGEKKSSAHRKQDGYSGIRYVFHWNDQVRAYTYDPKNQAEVDDLFKNKSMLVQYSPVEKVPAKAPVSDERLARLDAAIDRNGAGIAGVVNEDGTMTVTLPQGDPSAAAKPKLSPAFVEQCLARGVIVTEDDTDETANRLITAYDKGATDQLARVATAGAKPRKKTADTPSAKTA
jgi:hypothetical protein